jgi:hypothetical protein
LITSTSDGSLAKKIAAPPACPPCGEKYVAHTLFMALTACFALIGGEKTAFKDRFSYFA